MTAGLTAPIVGLIGVGMKYNSTVETLTSSFETMTGSAEEAGNIVKKLKDIGSKTPFEFTQLAETTKLLMNYGLTADEAIDKMKMLGDISQGNADKMGRISMAYGQMSSAGKVSLEDVKQMIEAGFNPLKEISESTGESMGSLYNRISKGSISVDEITKSMQRSTSQGGKYFGSMDKQSKTTSGRISTLKDNFNEAAGMLTKSLMPAFQKIIEKISVFATWVSKLDKDQLSFILTIAKVIAIIGPLLLIIVKVIEVVNIVTKATWLFNAALWANPVTWIIAGIAALIVIFVLLWTKCEGFRNFFINMFKTIIEVVSTVIDFFKNNWQTIFLFIMNPFAGAFKLLYDNFAGFRKVVDGTLNGIKNAFITVFTTIENVVSNIWNNILALFSTGGKIFSGITTGIGNLFKKIVNMLIDGINKVINIPFSTINGLLNNIRSVSVAGIKPFKGLWSKNPISTPNIPKLSVGTNNVAREGLAYLHQGEAVVPKKYNPAIGGGRQNIQPIFNVSVDVAQDPLGQMVKTVKTYSGGAKNSYNYGGGM